MDVETEVDGHVLVVTMTREHKRNAVDRAMADELSAAFDRLEDDPQLRCGVLQARGQVFCAGSDLTARGDYVTERGGEYGLIRRRRRTPLIAAVDGPALGGGLEIALACDLVVASTAASFGLPEVSIGVLPTCGGLFRGPRALPLNVARQLVLTGEPLPAAELAGFVTVLTEPGGASAAALAMARRIAGNSPSAVRACMVALDRVLDGDGDGWAATDAAAAGLWDSPDAVEGVAAFLGRREPVWAPLA